jgi:hypothetical protein
LRNSNNKSFTHLTHIKSFLQESIVCILFIVIVNSYVANDFIRNSAIDSNIDSNIDSAITDQDNGYSIKAFRQSLSSPNNSVILAFSGRGMRTEALSYSVLQ